MGYRIILVHFDSALVFLFGIPVALQQEVADANLIVKSRGIFLLHGCAIVINGIKIGFLSAELVTLLLQFLSGCILWRWRNAHGSGFRLGRGGWNAWRLLSTEREGYGEQDDTAERAEATHGGSPYCGGRLPGPVAAGLFSLLSSFLSFPPPNNLPQNPFFFSGSGVGAAPRLAVGY